MQQRPENANISQIGPALANDINIALQSVALASAAIQHTTILLATLINESETVDCRPFFSRISEDLRHVANAQWCLVPGPTFWGPSQAIEEVNAFFSCLDPKIEKHVVHFLSQASGFINDGHVPAAHVRQFICFIAENLSPQLAGLVAASSAFHSRQADSFHSDLLTGLPNRQGFTTIIKNHITGADANTDITVMHIDMGGVKNLNQMSGHVVGDAAVVHVGRAINGVLGETTKAARIGGDEFIIMLRDISRATEIAKIVQDLINTVDSPFDVLGAIHHTSISVGIASGRADTQRAIERILHNAEIAMRQVKKAGKRGYAFFQPQMRTQRDVRQALRAEIENGMANGEFVPFFQPQVAGRSGKIIGLEALARWQHPRRGLLAPNHFMELADNEGLLGPLDRLLTNQIFAAARSWSDIGLGLQRVSINITPNRLKDPNIVEELKTACESAGISPVQIGLEILESAMIESDSRKMIENAAALSALGFHLELDDFGTGHASVSNLRFMKINRIKIDKSFVIGIHRDVDLGMIVAALIGMAHNLRIDVLAEGVEQPEERLILNALGCDYLQGYGVSRPMPENEVAGWITKNKTPSRAALLNRLQS